MRIRSCETYWLLKNGLIKTYPTFRKNATCDVLVIGGGITGSLMAYRMARNGFDTMLIDRGDVSLGSTSATTALLQYEIDSPLFELAEKVGAEPASDCYRGGVEAIRHLEQIIVDQNIQCEFERRRSIYIAHNDDMRTDLLREFECRKDAGIEVTWLSAPALKAGYGIDGHGAILSETAASVDGYRLAHGLLDTGERSGKLQIFDHTEIISIDYLKNHNEVILRGGWKIAAGTIVFATGYETLSFLPERVARLTSTYACVSEPLESIPDVLKYNLLWTTDDPYLYVRSTADNRILVGGGDLPFRNAKVRDSLIDKKESELTERLALLLPGLKIIPDFTWAGTFGITKDALPYIGPHPDYSNCYFVLGFGGNGITFSVMGMDIISDAIAGRPNRFLTYFRFGR